MDHLKVIGRAACPEAWSFEGAASSFLDGDFRFVYRVCAAGDICVEISLPRAVVRDGIIAATISLRRELERRVIS